jgi:hypothetical protein
MKEKYVDPYEKVRPTLKGEVIQMKKLKFAFSVDKRYDVVDWLEEHNIEYNTTNWLWISFTTIYDPQLAMEFKLRFVGT